MRLQIHFYKEVNARAEQKLFLPQSKRRDCRERASDRKARLNAEKIRAENEGGRVYLKLFTNGEKNSTINRLEII